MTNIEERFDGVYLVNGKLATMNLVPGEKVYGEKLISVGKKEYRIWDPNRSKLAAAIKCGLNKCPISKNSKILYLGISTGTTASHISDIIGRKGIIYGIEFSERVMHNVIDVAKKRENIVPVFADARKVNYLWVEGVDVVYCDIAQPDQTDVAIRNCNQFLKPDGFLLLSIKSQSIDVTKDSKKVYEEEADKLKDAGFEILEFVNIGEYEKNHGFVVAKK